MAELKKESMEMAMDMVAAMGVETYARRICQPVSAVLGFSPIQYSRDAVRQGDEPMGRRPRVYGR